MATMPLYRQTNKLIRTHEYLAEVDTFLISFPFHLVCDNPARLHDEYSLYKLIFDVRNCMANH